MIGYASAARPPVTRVATANTTRTRVGSTAK